MRGKTMSLQFITGASGSGKSTYIDQQIIVRSEKRTGGAFFLSLCPTSLRCRHRRIWSVCMTGRDYEYRRPELRTSDAPHF